MTDAEKMAERLESVTLFQSYEYNLALNNEAAALAAIREAGCEVVSRKPTDAMIDQTDELTRLRSENSELKITGNAIYDAAYWTADRPVNQELLWTNFRNALGRNQGNSPKPVNIANE
jgi:hypothetical protein